MGVFSAEAFDNHEVVAFGNDAETGLRSIIAVHSTALGPAAGGCRMWPYAGEDEAIRDVLRLARGMSYKNAMAGLNLGGGKAVIIGDSRKHKTPELMRAFGRFVDTLGGKYITAEDVGMSVADMEVVAGETKYVGGLTTGQFASGDPSPLTAHGVFVGIRAAVRHKLGRDDLEGLTVAVQGVGHVGYKLCKMLHQAGAKLIVADIYPDLVEQAAKELGAVAVAVDEILSQGADVVAPCALGAILDDASIPKIKAAIVAGAANNQLARDEHGEALRQRGILYAPDYVINAGGIINIAFEVEGVKPTRQEAEKRVETIYGTLLEVFEKADAEGRPTHEVADAVARARIAAAHERKIKEFRAA